MLDIWYKKVKETNNFSCLYDDIDDLLSFNQDRALRDVISFKQQKITNLFVSLILLLTTSLICWFCVLSPKVNGTNSQIGLNVYNPIPLAVMRGGIPLPGMPPVPTATPSSPRSGFTSSAPWIGESRKQKNSALKAVKDQYILPRGAIMIVQSDPKGFNFVQGLEYTLEPEQTKKFKTNQLVDLANIDLNRWSQENVRPKTLLGRTSKKRLTSQFWYEFTQKQKLRNAQETSVVIYDITDNSILPVETLNQNNPLSKKYLGNLENFVKGVLSKYYMTQQNSVGKANRVKNATVIEKLEKVSLENTVFDQEYVDQALLIKKGLEKAHTLFLSGAEFGFGRIEGDSTSNVLFVDPALHEDMDNDKDAKISVKVAQTQTFPKILENGIETTKTNILKFNKPFQCIKANVHSEKHAMILGITAARYETAAKLDLAVIEENLGFFAKSTVTDAWLLARSITAIENKANLISKDITAFNTNAQQASSDQRSELFAELIKKTKKNNTALRYYADYAQKGLGMLYSYYLPDPKDPSNTEGLNPKIVSFLRVKLDTLNMLYSTLFDLYLKIPSQQLDQIDAEALIVKNALTPEALIQKYAHDFKTKTVEERLLNPFDKQMVQLYSKQVYRMRGLEILGFNSLKKINPIKASLAEMDTRRALSVYAESQSAPSTRQRTKSMFTDVQAVQNTFEQDGLSADITNAIVIRDLNERLAQEQLTASSLKTRN